MKKFSLFVLPFILVAFIISSTYAQTPTQATPSIKVLFSPQDNCAQEIISEIDKAKDYVYVAIMNIQSVSF